MRAPSNDMVDLAWVGVHFARRWMALPVTVSEFCGSVNAPNSSTGLEASRARRCVLRVPHERNGRFLGGNVTIALLSVARRRLFWDPFSTTSIRAKIFMGDSGACSSDLHLAAISLVSPEPRRRQSSSPSWCAHRVGPSSWICFRHRAPLPHARRFSWRIAGIFTIAFSISTHASANAVSFSMELVLPLAVVALLVHFGRSWNGPRAARLGRTLVFGAVRFAGIFSSGLAARLRSIPWSSDSARVGESPRISHEPR